MLKLVINRSYGGFSIPKSVAWELGYYNWYSIENIRGDLRFVNMVEENPDRFKDLMVVEIPWASDYKIVDYDGMESVIYVVNGKLHRAPIDWGRLEL